MRLPTAFASLGVTLLFAAPTAAQSTTTDVYYPDILSAAGNVTGLPGGNALCGSDRVRKPWGALRSDEQELYLEATKMAIADGGVADFAAIAADSLGQAQGEYSCAFFSSHRRLLMAYESYLRHLDERFACLTVPYYDVHTAYIQAVTGKCTNMFECSGIFEAMGARANWTNETTSTFNGVEATGYAVTGSPYQESCNGSECSYVVRGNLSSKSVPSAASFSTFQSVVATSDDYASFLEGIQYGVHSEVLNAIGGTISTVAAAHDVLYYSWYSALDMYLHVYHLCRIGVPLTASEIIESLEVFANATQTCGGVAGVDAESALVMRVSVDGKLVDVSQHPTLGQYFGYVGSEMWNYADIQQLGDYSYTYQLPEMMRQQILSNNDMCTGFNRAFSATYTTLSAAAVKNTTTTKTTTKTTTTKTTSIVNGKKVTTTRVTKVTTKANSTSTITSNSTVTNGQRVSKYGYKYLGNFSTDNAAFGEGIIVSNGYTGYMAYYSNGAITTKHNGIISANYSASTTSSDSASYSSMSNMVVNVTVGTKSVARNITASVATSGSYWAWLQTAYDGLFTRFGGNVDLVATHMKLLECYTFDSVYGLSNFTSTFVTNKNLVTNRVDCGQRLDLVRSGLLQMAVRSTAYSAESLKFASPTVIEFMRISYTPLTTRNLTYIRKSYTQKVQTDLNSMQKALDNITVSSTGGVGGHKTSTTVVKTGYMTSNSTSTTQQSPSSASIVTTTTTTTAADVSEPLSQASSNSTNHGKDSTVSGGKTITTGQTITATPAPMMPGATPAPMMPGATPAPMMPGATPAPMMPGDTPAPMMPGDTPAPMMPGATPAPMMPGATPAPMMPGATPAPMMPGATPAPTIFGGMMPGATPAPTMPDAPPAPTILGGMMPGATPAPTMPDATPAPTILGGMMPGATPAPTLSGETSMTQPMTCFDVSVTGDATYCIEGPICSGSGDLPDGSMCPMKGDIAVQDCHETLASYMNSSTCIAPEDALCAKIDTGAWGCIFDSEFATPAPTTMQDMSTPAPTTMQDMSTPAPTTMQDMPTPAPTTMPTPASITSSETEKAKMEKSGQSTKASMAYSTANSNVDEDYTIEQQQQQLDSPSSLYAARTSSNTSNSGPGVGSSTIVGIVAAVAAVVAIVGFAGFKMRQRPSNQHVSPSSYYVQPVTPTTQSMPL